MLKNVVSKVLNTLCVIIIIGAVLILCATFFDKSGNGIFGYYSYRVATGSMEPEIKTDSLIIVKACEDPTALEVGEIISFYSRDPQLQGSVNTHRIESVNIREDGSISYTTRGDANYVSDKYEVESGDVIGTVVFVSYILGFLTRLISNPIVFIPLVAIPLVSILVINIRNTILLSETIKREEEEQALKLALEEIRKQKALRDAQKTEENVSENNSENVELIDELFEEKSEEYNEI